MDQGKAAGREEVAVVDCGQLVDHDDKGEHAKVVNKGKALCQRKAAD